MIAVVCGVKQLTGTLGALCARTLFPYSATVNMARYEVDHHKKTAMFFHRIAPSQVITLAARGGGWREANPCCCLTLPQLELMLCLPTPLFSVVR